MVVWSALAVACTGGAVTDEAEGASPPPQTSTPATVDAPAPAPSVEVVNHGLTVFETFDNGSVRHQAWTSGDLVIYTPLGWVGQEDMSRWFDWYHQVDELYRRSADRPDFEAAYRAEDPNFGTSRVMAIVDVHPMFCGGQVEAAGCGNKSKAQGASRFMADSREDPTDPAAHWILFYEMGRGGPFEPFEQRAVWPPDAWATAYPHLMAGIALQQLGGPEAMDRAVPGDLVAALADWEAVNGNYTASFPDESDRSADGFSASELVAAMLLQIMVETDPETVFAVLAEVATKPPALEPVGAMCDFQAAVNTATEDRFADRFVERWGLPVCR